MSKKIFLISFLFIFSCLLLAQEKSNGISVSLSGFVKTDFMFDSRQTVTAREGHFLLYPAAEIFDANGEDVNASPNFNVLAIQSRIKLSISGPEILGAKSSSVIEGAFFGHSNSDINGFRLRHAIVKLAWENDELIVGQYWHPMFIEEVFPGVVSFNTGVPFMPFSRNPQVKYSHKFGDVKFSLTAASQRDFPSTGPNGGTSEYLRNSALPILNANVRYLSKSFVVGAGVNYQSLKPELKTEQNYKSDEKVNSVAFEGFAKYTKDNFTVKLFGTYGENLYDLLMLGGYGVASYDSSTALKTYTNMKTLSMWTELIYGSDIRTGLFAGYTKNLGSSDEVVGSVYSRGSNINSVFRISPRVEVDLLPLRIAFELEATTAEYGIPNTKYKVENYSNVTNVRALVAVYYFFK